MKTKIKLKHITKILDEKFFKAVKKDDYVSQLLIVEIKKELFHLADGVK